MCLSLHQLDYMWLQSCMPWFSIWENSTCTCSLKYMYNMYVIQWISFACDPAENLWVTFEMDCAYQVDHMIFWCMVYMYFIHVNSYSEYNLLHSTLYIRIFSNQFHWDDPCVTVEERHLFYLHPCTLILKYSNISNFLLVDTRVHLAT